MIGQDPYYGRPEVSNSDLSELAKYFMPSSKVLDLEQAYRFGNLVDALITEPHRCDHLKLKVDDTQFTSAEWNKAMEMVNAFRKDEFCAKVLSLSSGQNVFTLPDFHIDYEGIGFKLPVRCKYDLFMPAMGYGADIKSTVATSQKQFEDLIEYFDYDRQRAWYMDITGAKRDMLIGISKVNNKIFKVPITTESSLYKQGKEKYQSLAFKWYYLFEELNTQVYEAA